MSANPIRVAVTGAAGQIGYSLLFRIASGEIFGPNQPVVLHLIEVDVPEILEKLKGTVMEIEDCAFPLLKGVIATGNLDEGFKGVNWCLLVGAAPRKAGMERKDLLGANGKIFVGQGQAIQKNAAGDVRVLVVGNPCNTNCLVAYNNGRDIPAERWTAMTRLDHNRARAALAKKAGVGCGDVTNVTIWGNHSNTQYPDFTNAKIKGKAATEVITDRGWLENTFVPQIQNRGAAVIKARGASSAMSAANGALDHVKGWLQPTAAGDWISVAVVSKGEYGVPPGLVFSYPCRGDGKGNFTPVDGVKLDAFGQEKFKLTLKELEEERDAVKEMLK